MLFGYFNCVLSVGRVASSPNYHCVVLVDFVVVLT